VTTSKEVLIYVGDKKKIDGEVGDEVDVADDDGDGVDAEVKDKNQPILSMKKISYNSGLLRLVIEAISNAIDNKWRSETHGVVMKKIDFMFYDDPESEWYGWIGVVNDGYAIPVQKAEYEYEDYRSGEVTKEKMYPAEVFFGEMLAGTNFEEDDTRKTSGRNGLGGKLDVIYSLEAIIDHANSKDKKRFQQFYRNHGKGRDPPIVTSYSAKTDYFSISFLPDYEYFGYPGMDDDFISLLKRYAYETAMITGLNVTVNGEKINVKGLDKFVRCVYPDTKENCLMHYVSPSGDECVLVERGIPEMDTLDDVLHHSWINGINTRDGGVHVDAWRDAIFPSLTKAFNARPPKKGEKSVLKATAKELYPYFVIFVRCEKEGAKFDGQTKDRMNGPEVILADDKKSFNKYINDSFKKVFKWNFMELIEEKLAAKADRSQSKKEGTKKRLAYGGNLSDANYAGTKWSSMCTLIITEGKSAKAFADRMVSKMENGTDYYGTVAIRGKFINVQNASTREINKNVEVQMIKDVLALRTGIVYTSVDELRYGRVMIMSDQDDDGYHIRGLLMNFFYTMWPSLYQLDIQPSLLSLTQQGSEVGSFVSSFTTRVGHAHYNLNGKKQFRMFFSNPELRAWYEKVAVNATKVKVEYYKGLGTHLPGDEQVYLKDPKLIEYFADGEEVYYMDLGFNKKWSDERKEWITSGMKKPGTLKITDSTETQPIITSGEMSLAQFITEQLIIYHRMALSRALPNMYDGFKESQRKIFYGISKDPSARRGLTGLVGVIGSVITLTKYHHGKDSLENGAKNMAQGFVGSNNIPLLVNGGEFGTRMEGGKDSAASRYIKTCLEDITDTIFHPMDEPILERAQEDYEDVEYKMYVPVVPPIALNGAAGIATGYSTGVPCYNPDDVIDWFEARLDSEDGKVYLPRLKPWYRGFTGEIELLSKDNKTYRSFDPDVDDKPVAWRSKGILNQVKGQEWEITEVPIGVWTNRMKEYLEYLYTGSPGEGSKKKKSDRTFISNLKWKGTTNTVKWTFKAAKDFIPDINVAGNFKVLQTTESLTNMHVIDENGYPRKYTSIEDLFYDFYNKRLHYYGLRKKYWSRLYQEDYNKESDRYKFVTAVINKKLDMHQEDEDLENDMLSLGLRKVNGSFDYLLSMQMKSMTKKRIDAIKNDIEKIKERLDDIKSKSPKDLWREDLVAFRAAWKKFQKTRKEE